MNRLHTPWFFIGPNGSGKTTMARQWIEEAHGGKITLPMEMRNFSVGDGYETVSAGKLLIELAAK